MKVTYKSEAEAREDWQTIAPEYRTQERLAEMLAQVRPTGSVAPMACECGNDDPDQMETVISGGNYIHHNRAGDSHGSVVLRGWKCKKCGTQHRCGDYGG